MRRFLAGLFLSSVAAVAAAQGDKAFDLEYVVTVRQASRDALVEVRVGGGDQVKRLAFELKPGRQGEVSGDGKLV